MKEHKKRDRATGAATLLIRTTRGEELDYKLAEWLKTRPSSSLLPFKYEVKGSKNLFYYDITGYPTLQEYLGMGISGVQYQKLLRSVGALGDVCAQTDLPMESVRFEPEAIYVDSGNLLFCCLPITPAPNAKSSILTLLEFLAQPRNIRFVLPSDAELTRHVDDYVKRVSVFSAFDFNDVLNTHFHLDSHRQQDSQSSLAQAESTVASERHARFDPFGLSAGSETNGKSKNPIDVKESADSDTELNVESILSEANVTARLSEDSQDAAGIGLEETGTRLLAPDDSRQLQRDTPSPSLARSSLFSVIRERDGSRLCQAQAEVVVGRLPQCAARVRGNTNVSRVHALIVDMGDGTFGVSDLGSANGTTVRGIKLAKGERAPVRAGEAFVVADESLHIEV